MLLLYPNKNRSFAPISTLKRDSALKVKTPQLPKTVGKQLNEFYNAITGGPLQEDTVSLVCQFDKATKAYVKTYAPSIYGSDDGQACIVWGNEFFPLTNELVNELDADVRIEELEQYKETVLVLVLEIDDDYVELPLRLNTKKEFNKEPLTTFKKIVKQSKDKSKKTDIQDLAPYLFVKSATGGGDFPTTYALKELEQNKPYYLVGAELKDFGSHTNYVLETQTAEGDTVFCYAPKVIFNALANGAIITYLADGVELENASYFTFVIDDSGKKAKYIVVPENIEWPDDEELVKF